MPTIDILTELSALGNCTQGTYVEDVTARAAKEFIDLRRQLEDARKAQDGATALLCDAQAEIATLQEQIEAQREANILMGATVRMFEDALRPFAETARANDIHEDDPLRPLSTLVFSRSDLARAAEMVPEDPNP